MNKALRGWGKVGLSLALALVISLQATSPVSALYGPQRKVYDNSIKYFNVKDEEVQPGACGGTGSGGTSNIPGSDNQEKAFNYFVGKGLSPAQSAGIVGNFIAESSVVPDKGEGGATVGQPTPNVGFGIAQWTTPGRQQGLIDLAKQQGKPVTDLNVQLDYAWQELNGGYKGALTALQGSNSADEAADIIMVQYEAPKDHAIGGPNSIRRRGFANDVLGRYGGGAAASNATSGDAQKVSVTTTGCGTAGTTDCSQNGGTVKGKAAILCEARKFDPFGYLWGGGHGDPEQFMADFNAAGGYSQPFKQYLDCSGLERIAIWNAFHYKMPGYSTDTMNTLKDYRAIPIENTQPGDVVWRKGHTEIVSSPGAATTFGAHTDDAPPESQISEVNRKETWSLAYEYIGPGSDQSLL